VNSLKRLCAILTLSALFLPACGGDDKSNNGLSAEAQAYLTSCQNLCVKEAATSCTDIIVMPVADCKSLCDAMAQAMPANCGAKYKDYGQCTDNLSDICTINTACSTQMEAMSTCK
jgi:hypothetical protein